MNSGSPVSAHEPESRFPAIAWEWDKTEFVEDWHEPLFDLMARYVPAHSRVLEVGAGGSPTLGMLAARLECLAYGCEPDVNGITSSLRLAGIEAARVLFVRGDGFSLPFSKGEFDVVYSLGLIEHFQAAQTAALVAEHARVCKPGGRVIISVPNLLNLPHTVSKFIQGTRYRYYPERSFSPKELRSVIERAGLRYLTSDGLLPLWGIGMMRGGWRINAALGRMGLARLLRDLQNPRLRAMLGYMTFAVCERMSLPE